MTMTLLQLIQEFTARTGLDIPTMVGASTDAGVKQCQALMNEVITDLTGRGQSWPALQRQATFVSVAAEQQGLMTTIAPYGYQYVIEESLYDRTERRPLYGPRNAPRWQESEALPVTGPFYSYRIWNGYFNMQPAPPAGHTIAFEYSSNYAIQGATSASDATLVYRRRFLYDADVFLLDEELLLLGLRWKWKKEKGLSFATEKLDYESYLAQCTGNDGTKGELSMSGDTNGDIKPGIFVPLGNWPV